MRLSASHCVANVYIAIAIYRSGSGRSKHMAQSIFRAFIITATLGVALLLSETRLVVAQDDQQCSEYRFDAPFFPGNSCEDIYNKNPQTRHISGYYWITDGPSRVYCGMNCLVKTFTLTMSKLVISPVIIVSAIIMGGCIVI